MRRSWLVLVAFTALAGAEIGCGSDKAKAACESGPRGALLSEALGASDRKAFDDAVGRHGPVQADELPCLTDAATGLRMNRRRFAAALMVLVRTDDPAALRGARARVAQDTSDPVVWTTLVRAMLDSKAGLDDAETAAIGRAPMVENALKFEDGDDAKLTGEVQAVGLRAGLRAGTPGIQGELSRRLEAHDTSLLVALHALPAESAKAELPRLLALLSKYEAGEKFPGDPGDAFTAIIGALARSGEATGMAAARAALTKDLTDLDSVRGSRPELTSFRNHATIWPEPEMTTFLLGTMRDDHAFAPVAVDILTTQVWANHLPPGVALVTACVGLLEKGLEKDRSPRRYAQYHCSDLFYFMATGASPIDRSKGPKLELEASVAKAKEWLEACTASKACAP